MEYVYCGICELGEFNGILRMVRTDYLNENTFSSTTTDLLIS